MSVKFFLTIIFSLFPCLVWSEVVSVMNYEYKYNGASGLAEPTFVICDCLYSIPLALVEKGTPYKVEKNKALLSAISIKVTKEERDKNLQENRILKEKNVNTEITRKNTIIGTIFFDFNSSRLKKNAILELDRIIKTIKSEGFSDITIEGYTCDIGTEEYNKKLSQKRANTVASYLRTRNIDISKVEGKGECYPISDIKRENRRVEILGGRE